MVSIKQLTLLSDRLVLFGLPSKSILNICAHIQTHETMHKHYWLTLNFRHKIISSGNANPQETIESFKYPLMELSCKY